VPANPLAPSWLRPPRDPGALGPIWSATASRAADGGLVVGGVAATELAERYGTPLYVVDEHDLRGRARAVRDAFDTALSAVGSRARVYYAAKSFLCSEVARWVTDAGLGVDVCTGGELAVALAAGVDPGRIGFHGNNKSPAEIDRAVGVGVGVLVIDSVMEIDRVADAAARHSRRQPVRLRVNSGVHATTHEYLATAREDQKFGIALPDVEGAVARIRSFGSLELLGLHSHIGSQILAGDGFEEAARRLLDVHARLLVDGPVPELNLGGGFGIAYTDADEAAPIEAIADRIARTVASRCAELGIPVPVVACEPGRIVSGPPGLTLYEVGTLKDVAVDVTPDASLQEPGATPTAVRRYVSVDGGMSDNARPALYRADYSVRLANRSGSDEPALVRVVGKHCESGDIVVRDGYLPDDVRPGDLLAVPATGAYCWSLASSYNYLGRAPVVAVRDGAARLLVRGETEHDLLARDAGLSAGPRTERAAEPAGAAR